MDKCQSPQWGRNSKVIRDENGQPIGWIQSPQWGSNSKVHRGMGRHYGIRVSVPAMVDVNSAVHCLRIDICISAIKRHNQAFH